MNKLVSVSDIATMYDISRYKIWNWHRRCSHFPKPVQYVNNGKTPLFDSVEIETFIIVNGDRAED
jgi:predicted DNA-binding transcriptional regulator AlpA